jgi:predicted nucleotide-binding protein
MRKSKKYRRTKFAPEIVRNAVRVLLAAAEQRGVVKPREPNLRVFTEGGESWHHDEEAEYFADYRRNHDQSTYTQTIYVEDRDELTGFSLEVDFAYGNTTIHVEAPDRPDIAAVFEVFEEAEAASNIPAEPESATEKAHPTVFIGHGRDSQWRDLKDHLTDKHGYTVVAYETGARAGHTIRDILDELTRSSSFALLVLTGEDELESGELHPRLNVVHELGLFQGALGFTRAIALLEEGATEFSNIHGINQIRFSKGNVRETYGEVLATLRREFGVS